MSSILKGLMGTVDTKLNDQVIALSTDFAIKSAANAYLTASLNAVTPEVRRLWSDFLTRKITAHESLSTLILKKNWAQPYSSIDEQMYNSYKQSAWVLNQSPAQP